jgi:hypothetical protein
MRRFLTIIALLTATMSTTAVASAPQVQTKAPTLEQPVQTTDAPNTANLSKPTPAPQMQHPQRHTTAGLPDNGATCSVYVAMLEYPTSVASRTYIYKQFAAEKCAPRLLTGDNINRYMRCTMAKMAMRDIINSNRAANGSTVVDNETYGFYQLAATHREALQCS